MTHRFIRISTVDLRTELWVLLLRARNGRLKPRPEYQDLACTKCGRFDELEALKRGVSSDVHIVAGLDFYKSDDDVLIVSATAKSLLDDIAGGWIQSFPFGDGDFWALYPNRVFSPPANARIYTPIEPAIKGEAFQCRSRPCKKCGRYRSVTFQLRWCLIPEDTAIAGAKIEMAEGVAGMCWIASEQVAKHLRASGLHGLRWFSEIR